ncbi:MAG: hypothetical protein FWD38_08455 [Oscillospiraceae bacterium]|nr:hypothetical protein [Oscillospiraceae bacterium]
MSTVSMTEHAENLTSHPENVSVFSFNSDRLSHAYITDESVAETIAMAVVCSERKSKRPCQKCSDCSKASRRIHPDIIEVGKLDDKLLITVDQIRALKKDVYIVPNDSMQKAYIIKSADTMNTNAQNALLQILEEPPKHTAFILCTDNPAALLPTVRSRCVELRAHPGDIKTADENELTEDDSGGIFALADSFIDAVKGDNIKLMECMFQIDKLDRQDLGIFLETTRQHIIIKVKENLGTNSQDYIKTLINAEEILQKAEEMHSLNVSAGNISGYLCASMIKV